MYLLDTNLHIAYLIQDQEADPTSQHYVSRYKEIPPQQIMILDVILGEIDLVVKSVLPKKYKLSPADRHNLKTRTKTYLSLLKDQAYFSEITSEIIKQTIDTYTTQTSTLSFNDLLILFSAQKTNTPLITLDQNLRAEAQRQNIPTQFL